MCACACASASASASKDVLWKTKQDTQCKKRNNFCERVSAFDWKDDAIKKGQSSMGPWEITWLGDTFAGQRSLFCCCAIIMCFVRSCKEGVCIGAHPHARFLSVCFVCDCPYGVDLENQFFGDRFLPVDDLCIYLRYDWDNLSTGPENINIKYVRIGRAPLYRTIIWRDLLWVCKEIVNTSSFCLPSEKTY